MKYSRFIYSVCREVITSDPLSPDYDYNSQPDNLCQECNTISQLGLNERNRCPACQELHDTYYFINPIF